MTKLRRFLIFVTLALGLGPSAQASKPPPRAGAHRTGLQVQYTGNGPSAIQWTQSTTPAVFYRQGLTTTAAQATYTTSSFNPAAGDLLVVLIGASGTVIAGSMSDSLGGTWTAVTTKVKAASVDTLYAFVRDSSVSGTGMTVTFDLTADQPTGLSMFVAGVTNMTHFGASSVVQSNGQSNQTAGTTPAPAFGVAAGTTHPTICFLYAAANTPTVTPPTNWTEDASTQGELGYGTPTDGVEWCHRDSGFTGTTITWGSTSAAEYGDIIMELNP